MSGTKKGKVHMWTDEEDALLVAALEEVHKVGTFNAENGFKPGYLPLVEKSIRLKLPDTEIRVKPHIESRMRTLRKDFTTVWDMVYGPSTSGFGWDPINKCVVAESNVWEAYVKSHPRAANFRNKSFEHFDVLCTVFGKDRAQGTYAEAADDVQEDVEEYTGTEILEFQFRDFLNSLENNIGIQDDNISGSSMNMNSSPSTMHGPASIHENETEGTSSGSNKRRKTQKINQNMLEGIRELVEVLGDKFERSTDRLGDVLGAEKRYEDRRQQFFNELQKMSEISTMERLAAAKNIGENDTWLVYYSGLQYSDKVEFVKSFHGSG